MLDKVSVTELYKGIILLFLLLLDFVFVCVHVYGVCLSLAYFRDRKTGRKPQRSCCLHCPQFRDTDVCSRPCPAFSVGAEGLNSAPPCVCPASSRTHTAISLATVLVLLLFLLLLFLMPWEEWGRWHDLNVSPPCQFHMLELNPGKYVSNLKGSILERWLDCKNRQEHISPFVSEDRLIKMPFLQHVCLYHRWCPLSYWIAWGPHQMPGRK